MFDKLRQYIALRLYPKLLNDLAIPKTTRDLTFNQLHALREVTRFSREIHRNVEKARDEYYFSWYILTSDLHQSIGWYVTDKMRQDGVLNMKQLEAHKEEQALNAMIKSFVEALTERR